MRGKQLYYLATLPLSVWAGGAERHTKGVSTMNGDHTIGRKQLQIYRVFRNSLTISHHYRKFSLPGFP